MVEIVEYLIKPEVYNELYREEQYVKYKCLLKLTGIIKGLILDAGCGTGLLYEYLEKSGIKGFKYVCMDPSHEMLLIAKSKVNSPLALLLESYAEDIPIRSSTFNYVFSVSTWGVISDKAKALRELKRVTMPQGLLVITGYPNTFTIKPPDLDPVFKETIQCIDYFYTAKIV